MQQSDLQVVLLVKAIEEADRSERLLSADVREGATRRALESSGLPPDGAPPNTPDGRLSRAITLRAQELLHHLRSRQSIFDDLLAISSWRRWVALGVLASAAASGFGMAALPKEVNVLRVTYLGLIALNTITYLWLLFRPLVSTGSGGPGIAHLLGIAARWIEHRLTKLLAESDLSHETVTRVGRLYFDDWRRAAGPVFAQGMQRMFHLSAAVVATGVIVGLYSTAWDQRVDVCWESSIVSEERVKRLIELLMPVAQSLGVDLPATVRDCQADAALPPAQPGTNALPWINFFVLILVLSIVVPRLLLVAGTSAWRAWLQREDNLPDAVREYAIGTLGNGEGRGLRQIHVFPYDFEPGNSVDDRLDSYVRRRYGRDARSVRHPTMLAGQEHALRREVEDTSAWRGVSWRILVTLGSKPDGNSHGIMLATAKETAQRTANDLQVVLLVDEAFDKGSWVPEWWHEKLMSRRRRQWVEFASRSNIDVEILQA